MEHKTKYNIRKQPTGGFERAALIIAVLLLAYMSYQVNAMNNNLVILNSNFATGNVEDANKGAGNVEAQVKQQAPTPTQPPAPTQATKTDMAALIENDDVKGDENAPVTIVEWSDFECPYCARFYTQTYSQIVEEYVDTGKAKIAFRDFPLSFHANAQKAAESAECAGEQGKFWEMHDLLFEKGVTGGITTFKQYATDLGLDTASFNDCLDTGKMASEVQIDMRDGSAAGVRGTPAFIINGELISGAQPFSTFKATIEAKLAE